MSSQPIRRRYLSDHRERSEAFLDGARTYVSKLSPEQLSYLYQKPLDRNVGHATYFRQLYQILNLLQAMDLALGSYVVEVGCGPGWVTEILAGLGYRVTAIEPSDRMIQIAQARVGTYAAHHHVPGDIKVDFLCETLEECALPGACCDAVLFFEALHHVIDEELALKQACRILRPGGILAIGGDSNWQPGNAAQEAELEREMKIYGTLENPFTYEYLNFLLRECGFEDIVRYHGVNGLFSVENENRTVREVATDPASSLNTIVARKGGARLTTATARAKTIGEVRLLDASVDPHTRIAVLQLRLTNRGETFWLSEMGQTGQVNIALRQGDAGSPYSREAPRVSLDHDLAPGSSIDLRADFQLPIDYKNDPWYIDLVCERLFWFSQRGMPAVPVQFD